MTTPDQQETPSQPPAFNRKQAVRETRSMSELEMLVGETDITQALKEKAELALEDLQTYLEHRQKRGLRLGDVDSAARDAIQAQTQWETAIRDLEAKTAKIEPYDRARVAAPIKQAARTEAITARDATLDRMRDLRERLDKEKTSIGFFSRLFGAPSEATKRLQDELNAIEEERKVKEEALDAASREDQENTSILDQSLLSLGGIQGIGEAHKAVEEARAKAEELQARRDELARVVERDGFAPLLTHAEFFRSQLEFQEPLNPTNREAVVETVNQYIDTATAQGFIDQKPSG